MADTPISGLAAASSATATQEYAVNEASVSKKVTGAQIKTMANPSNLTLGKVLALVTFPSR